MSALAEAIERDAREAGLWAVVGTGELLRACERGEWFVTDGLPARGPGFSIGRSGAEWQVSELDAALWRLTHKAGHTIEQRCPDCDGDGWLVSCAQAEDGRPFHGIPSSWGELDRSETWASAREVHLHMAPRRGGVYASVWVTPCPTCTVDGKPTGRVHVPAHEVLLDIEPDRVPPCCDGRECGCMGVVAEDWGGVQEAREALTIHADQLQAKGDPPRHAARTAPGRAAHRGARAGVASRAG